MPQSSQGGITTPKQPATRGTVTNSPDLFTDSENDASRIDCWGKSRLKKLDNSQDMVEVLGDNILTINNDEIFDTEVISPEEKNCTIDISESSINEAMKSIILPQTIFPKKYKQPQKKFGHVIDNRESLTKLHNTDTINIDKTVNSRLRELFPNVNRSKIIFPSGLLNISPNKTDETVEDVLADPKPRVRKLFGNRRVNKRKNVYSDFAVRDTEEKIPEIQPKVFGFQKKLEQRRICSTSKGRNASPPSSPSQVLLLSSTMTENELDQNILADNTPTKRAGLRKRSEAKESEGKEGANESQEFESPEVIRSHHEKTNQIDSFTDKTRKNRVRKTKRLLMNLNFSPILKVSSRDSISFCDCTNDSSAEGSGWDSHLNIRKKLRRTLHIEKSVKRQTEQEVHNSTEILEDPNHHVEDIVESDHEVSSRTRRTALEVYLQEKEWNIEKRRKLESGAGNSFKKRVANPLDTFKVRNKPAPRRPKPAQRKPKKQLQRFIPLDELPAELIQDLMYKPPKTFATKNLCSPLLDNKRLHKFLESKLEAKYDYRARVQAEKLVEKIYKFVKGLRRRHVASSDAVDVLKREFARLNIVRTHFEFYEFFQDFMPREVRIKVVPDILNKIALPRNGVFSDIS